MNVFYIDCGSMADISNNSGWEHLTYHIASALY